MAKCTKTKNRDFKILLLSFYNSEAIGIRQLFSVLATHGYQVKIIFLKLSQVKEHKVMQQEGSKSIINSVTDKELDILAGFIADEKPDVIGVSLVSSHFNLYKRIYSRIRGLADFKIVLGGWQPTLNPEDCINYCDILCRGEGEKAFLELVDRLYNKELLKDTRNMWINDKDGVIKNPVRPLTKDLDSLPAAVFDAGSIYYIDNGRILNEEPYSINTRYGIMAGKGCPYHCTYCSNSFMIKQLYHAEWSKVRFRSVDHVISELSAVKSNFPNVKRINFYDEVFRPDKAWARDFFKRYKDEIGLPFCCEVYPGSCDEEMVKIMRDGMLSGVWIGVQSGSERVRKEIFKRFYTNILVLEQARLFNKYGISVRYDFILDNPFESFEESLESIRLMLQMEEPFSLNLFSLKYFPNTDITNMALKAGLITAGDVADRLTQDAANPRIACLGNDSESNFINHLAIYISFLADSGKVGKNRELIAGIIEDYRTRKNIDRIKNLLKPLLSEKAGI